MLAAVDGFVKECRDELGLPVVGLMAIPPEDEEPSLHFALLAEIAERNGLTQLSMGMSADYEIGCSSARPCGSAARSSANGRRKPARPLTPSRAR